MHAHTDLSDGVDTLDAMAEATRNRGYVYFGIADHSKSAHYAGGLSVEEIAEQHAAIDRMNAGYGGSFRVFKGIESDILDDGALDYPDEVLRRFDYTTILGHMTGRLLLAGPVTRSTSRKFLPPARRTASPLKPSPPTANTFLRICRKLRYTL